MKKNNIIIFSALFILTFIVSCSKGDKGQTGPQGLQGPQGPQGPQGIIGASGNVGQTGPQGNVGGVGPNAPSPTITYSSWVTTTNWVTGGTGFNTRSSAVRTAASITASVISNSIVLGFIKNFPSLTATLNNAGILVIIPNQVASLPYTEAESNNFGPPINGIASFLSEWSFALNTPGSITFLHKSAGVNFTVTGLNNSAIQTRYVIIPGGTLGGRFTSGPAAGYSVDQIKALSYEQIAVMFNIPASGTNEK